MIIGAQMFTVREFAKTVEDFAETLKKIADIGYTTVQVSGTCEFDPAWLKGELDKNGLQCVLTHTKGDRMMADPAQVCRDHAVFGCHNIGIGAIPGGKIDDEIYENFVKDFLPVAKVFRDNGCKLYYHNHQMEFQRDRNGKIFLDRFLEDFTPDLLGVTFDTYWAQYGGADPAAWLSKLGGRVECIHLKDMAIVDKEQRMAPVGSGNINFDRVLQVAEDVNVSYLLVEQDKCYDEDPFVCLKKSYDYLTALGLH